LVDTYTITYTDNTTSTFTVTNGEDGKDADGGTGATYDLILGTEGNEAGKLILVGSDGSRDIVELPGDISQGEAEGTLTSGVNTQAISQGSTAMGVDVTAGSKAFYIEAIEHNAETKTGKIYLKTTNVLAPALESEYIAGAHATSGDGFYLRDLEVNIPYTYVSNSYGSGILLYDGTSITTTPQVDEWWLETAENVYWVFDTV